MNVCFKKSWDLTNPKDTRSIRKKMQQNAVKWYKASYVFPNAAGLPFQAVPVLEWDGLQLAQSTAIANFVAKQAAPLLLGVTLEEQAWSDMAVAYTQDIFVGVDPRYFKWLDGIKEPVEKEAIETWLPNVCKKIDTVFLKDGKRFVAGDRVRKFKIMNYWSNFVQLFCLLYVVNPWWSFPVCCNGHAFEA